MLTLHGKYNSANIMLDEIDHACTKQLQNKFMAQVKEERGANI
jgi:hypothetical protein